MVQDVEVVLNKSATLTLKMLEKLLMVMVDVDICPKLALIPPIIKVILLYHLIL